MVTYNFDYISSKDKPYFEERVSKSCFIEQNLLLREFAESYVLIAQGWAKGEYWIHKNT